MSSEESKSGSGEGAEGAALSGALATAWGVREPAARGPKPALGLERILDAAVAVADAEGIEAVSMNRLARELGSAPMSIYRHLDSKEELLGLMVDTSLGDPPATDPEAAWRERLRRFAGAFRDRGFEHPWSVRLPIVGPPLTPNSVAWFEHGLAALEATGLEESEKASVVLLLTGYVRNHVMLMGEIGPFLGGEAGADAAMRSYEATLRGLDVATRFPALGRVLDAGVFDRADPPEAEFDFGLERILDGVAALVAERS
jgi:AcrR family transcriptional regulator